MTEAKLKVVCVSDKAYMSLDDSGNPQRPPEGERLSVSLTIGKVYEVLGEELGMYAIIDDTGGEYLFPKDRFRVLTD